MRAWRRDCCGSRWYFKLLIGRIFRFLPMQHWGPLHRTSLTWKRRPLQANFHPKNCKFYEFWDTLRDFYEISGFMLVSPFTFGKLAHQMQNLWSFFYPGWVSLRRFRGPWRRNYRSDLQTIEGSNKIQNLVKFSVSVHAGLTWCTDEIWREKSPYSRFHVDRCTV